MPLREYAEEFHHEYHEPEKCNECNQDVDPLDSSGANQDIDDYLNYVLANGYLRPDLCKDIGIRELLSPNKCKTSSGSSKYHCGHCCKGQVKDTSSHKGIPDGTKKINHDPCASHCGIFDKSKKPSGQSSASYYTPMALNLSAISSNHKRSTASGKSKSLSELAQKKEVHNAVEKEPQSSPSTENTLMQQTQTKTSPSRDSIQWKAAGVEEGKLNSMKRRSLEDISKLKLSANNVGLTRDPCPCSHGENFVRFSISSGTDSNCKETGL